MITPMKKITILCSESDRMKTVSSLREFGLVHVENVVTKTQSALSLETENSAFNKVLSFLDAYTDKKNPVVQENPGDEKIKALSSSILALLDEEGRISEKRRALTAEIERVKALGDFDPDELESLKALGYDITLYYIGKKEKEKLDADDTVTYISLKTGSRNECIALVNSELPQGIPAQRIVPPRRDSQRSKTRCFF